MPTHHENRRSESSSWNDLPAELTDCQLLENF